MATLIEYIIKITDNASAAFGGVSKGAEKVMGQMTRLNKCMWQFNQTAELFDRMGQTITAINRPGLEFQQSMADLSAITGIAGTDLEKLGLTARKTGIESGLGAVQAAESYKILASQIDVSKIGMEGLQLLQKQSITLAQASGLEMGAAAEALSGTINQFGLQASEAARITNVLAAGAKYGAAEIPDLAQSFKVVGAAANSAGLSVEATAGALEVLSKNNVKGAEAGTALRNVLLKMQTTLGVDFTKTSMSEALEQLKPKLKDTAYLTKVFGMENVVAAQFLVQNSKEVEEMTKRVTGTNVAQEQASIRTNTWAHTVDIFKAKINDMGISLTENAGGMLTMIQMGGQLGSGILSLGPIFSFFKDAVVGARNAINWLTVAENRNKIAKAIGTAAIYTQLVAMYAWDAIVGVLIGKITLVSVATAVWNAILAVNPVVWVVAGILALVAVLVIAYQKLGWFRGAVYASWEAIKGFGLLIKDFIVDGIKGILTGLGGLGQALVAFFKGDYKKAWDVAKQAGADLIGVGAAQNAIDNAKKIGAKMGTAYQQGVSEVDAKKEKAGIKTKEGKQSGIAPAGGLAGVTQTGGYEPPQPVKPDTEKVASGGTRNTNITINLGKMVENIVFQGGLKENENDLVSQVEAAMLRVLYSAQSAS